MRALIVWAMGGRQKFKQIAFKFLYTAGTTGQIAMAVRLAEKNGPKSSPEQAAKMPNAGHTHTYTLKAHSYTVGPVLSR